MNTADRLPLADNRYDLHVNNSIANITRKVVAVKSPFCPDLPNVRAYTCPPPFTSPSPGTQNSEKSTVAGVHLSVDYPTSCNLW